MRLECSTVGEICWFSPTHSHSVKDHALKCLRLAITLLIKITATQEEAALSYHRVHGLYFRAVVFAATVCVPIATNIYTIRYNIKYKAKNYMF